jgi:hypothetical protein
MQRPTCIVWADLTPFLSEHDENALDALRAVDMAEGDEGEEEEDEEEDDDNTVEEEEQSNGAEPEAEPEAELEAELEVAAAAAVGRGRCGEGKAAAKAAGKAKRPTAKKLQALGPTRMLSQVRFLVRLSLVHPLFHTKLDCH